MTKVLITGATGFLGRHLVRALAAEGAHITALCHEEKLDDAFLALGTTVVKGSVLDRAAVEKAAAGAEVLFHCAGRVSRDVKDAEMLYTLHVEGTKTALDAARAAGVKRAVIASTSGVVAVSKEPEPTDENAPVPLELIASWPYYRSKLFAEIEAFERNRDGFDVVAVNPALLLGPGDLTGSSTGDVIDIVEGRVPVVPGGGLSFVDARDAALGLVLAWKKGRPGRRYLLAGQNLSFRDFAARIARMAGVDGPKAELPRSRFLARLGADLSQKLKEHVPGVPALDRMSAEMANAFWYVDSTRAREELGWEPRDPMTTLGDTVDDLRDRGVLWPRRQASSRSTSHTATS